MPTLKSGDVIVKDNLSAHKVAGVRQAIEGVSASVFHLPPYSPALNPIEQLFAKIKAILCMLAARSKETLWNAIHITLERCHEDVFDVYFRHYGYRST